MSLCMAWISGFTISGFTPLTSARQHGIETTADALHPTSSATDTGRNRTSFDCSLAASWPAR